LELTGRYKTSFSISYADAFAMALAEMEGATVISTDHKEFDPVEKNGDLSFYWLR
jgi:predicted nucleic acid-binding protein